jgi:hypothetical protein
MWALLVHFWVSDGTFGTAHLRTFPTEAMCQSVGKDFLLHFPHTILYKCDKVSK